MVSTISVTRNIRHNNGWLAEGLDVLRRRAGKANLVDDAELTHTERALLATYTTACIGHDRRHCWPIDELCGDE